MGDDRDQLAHQSPLDDTRNKGEHE